MTNNNYPTPFPPTLSLSRTLLGTPRRREGVLWGTVGAPYTFSITDLTEMWMGGGEEMRLGGRRTNSGEAARWGRGAKEGKRG